jgi:hypothetical protein
MQERIVPRVGPVRKKKDNKHAVLFRQISFSVHPEPVSVKFVYFASAQRKKGEDEQKKKKEEAARFAF